MLKALNPKAVICIAILFLLIVSAPCVLRAQIPTEAEVHNRLGNEYCDRGEFLKAVKEYEEAINIYPNYIDAYYNLGVTYYHDLRDYQKAVHYFQKFLEFESGSPDAQQVKNWLADIEKTHGIKPGPAAPDEKAKIAEAKPAKKIKEAAPKEPPAEPAVPLQQEPAPEKAPPPAPKAEEKEGIEDKYKQAVEHKNRGNLYSKNGKYQMAVQEYLKAVQLRPGYTDALYNLGKTYDFDLNDKENAIKYYEEFLRYEPPASKDAKEVKTWILKAKMVLAKKEETEAEKKLAKEKAPEPIKETPAVQEKPLGPPVGAKFDDLPFTKSLLDAPVKTASLKPEEPPLPQRPKLSPPPPTPAPTPGPEQAPVKGPAKPADLVPPAESILLTSYLPEDIKSVQTTIMIRAEMRNELREIFKSKNAPDSERLAQLFLTKLRQERLGSGEEILNIEVPGDLIANINNVYILDHKDRIELNSEKGKLFRSQQTSQVKKRIQEINQALEDGYEIRPIKP